jgi:uncharacterized protein (TIGR03435 family)
MPRICRSAALFILVAAETLAQVSAPPRFEVASIKPNTSNDGYSRTNSDRGNLFVVNNRLLDIVRQAYGVRQFAIVAPAWLSGERFDVTAKFAAGASRDDRRLMMQVLLAERFHLTVHHETKRVPGFALKVAKNGPKIRPVEDKGDRNVLNQPVRNETG